jgi:hypothetical protein
LPHGSQAWHLFMTAGLFGFLVFSGRNSLFGIAFFFLTLSPALTLCRSQYLYIPSLGFAWIISSILYDRLLKNRSRSRSLAASFFMIVLLSCYAYSSISQNKEWERTGKMGREIKALMLATHPNMTADNRFIIISPFIDEKIKICLFQNGLTNAARIWYKNAGLNARRIASAEELKDFQKGRDIILEFVDEKVYDRSDDFDSKSAFARARLGFRKDIILASQHTQIQSGPFPTPLHGIEIQGYLTNSGWIEQNTNVLQVDLTFDTGETMEYDLRAGVEMSEWAHDRADVAPIVRHDRAPVAFDIIVTDADCPPFLAHSYKSTITWEGFRHLQSLKIESLIKNKGPHGESAEIMINAVYGVNRIDP